MATHEDKQQTWDDCPAGELVGLSGRLRRQSRRRQFTQMAAAAGFMAVLVVAAGMLMSTDGANRPVKALTCDQVETHLASYSGGQLSAEVREQVAAHLDHCPLCRRRLKQMQSQGRQESSAAAAVVTAAILP